MGTLAINIFGCFLIGLVFGLANKGSLAPEWKLFLATGLLGGFTTFSAFSMDTIAMLREGMLWNASAYILASVVVGLFATPLLAFRSSKFFKQPKDGCKQNLSLFFPNALSGRIFVFPQVRLSSCFSTC